MVQSKRNDQDTWEPGRYFQIMDFWNVYGGTHTRIMMSLFKIARVKPKTTRIDCAGYVGIACDLKDRYEAKK